MSRGRSDPLAASSKTPPLGFPSLPRGSADGRALASSSFRKPGNRGPTRAGEAGGADRARTGDPLVANQVLSQLSYSPMKAADGGPKWI